MTTRISPFLKLHLRDKTGEQRDWESRAVATGPSLLRDLGSTEEEEVHGHHCDVYPLRFLPLG